MQQQLTRGKKKQKKQTEKKQSRQGEEGKEYLKKGKKMTQISSPDIKDTSLIFQGSSSLFVTSSPGNKVKAMMYSSEWWQMAARGNCWTTEGFITQQSCHGSKMCYSTLAHMFFQS